MNPEYDRISTNTNKFHVGLHVGGHRCSREFDVEARYPTLALAEAGATYGSNFKGRVVLYRYSDGAIFIYDNVEFRNAPAVFLGGERLSGLS